MSVMSIAEAWPPAGRPFTVAELDRMPDDGRRYELLDGMLAVSPRPTPVHQIVSLRLASMLELSCPDGLQVIPEPAVQLSDDTEFDPDIVVSRDSDIWAAKISVPPVLVVEIRSPSTALIDLNRKKMAYERFGVASYWIVDPDLPSPALSAYELQDGGRYEQVAHVRGSQPLRARRPFPVEVVPAQLVAALPRPAS
ncbi:MAG: Uma2 family endonuclease [Actinobacteria bacterium]|nr:Uma2 family endonuclease [Actinomycetota bacterium]